MDLTSLLRVLIDGTRDEIAEALHEEVRFRQGDGTVHRGRGAVLEAFARSESGARYRVLEWNEVSVVVGIEVPGVPGLFAFVLCGRAVDERLVEVWVEA